MSIQKPNCSTCPNYPCNEEIANSATIVGGLEWQIEQLGCLSHPSAREYLMADVIQELEKAKSENRINGSVWCNGYDDALKLAIALIRDGVKK